MCVGRKDLKSDNDINSSMKQQGVVEVIHDMIWEK